MGFGLHYLSTNWWPSNPGTGILDMTVSLTGLILAGVVIYFILTGILGCRELRSIFDVFKPNLSGRKTF